MKLRLGISPCPNDTFIFHGLLYPQEHPEMTPPPYVFETTFADVEELNRLTMTGEPDVCKVSAHAAAFMLDDYVVLRSGGALGYGCGPLLLSMEPATIEDLWSERIAVPGRMTTGALLLELCGRSKGMGPSVKDSRPPVLYSEIMPALERGEIPAGVIIHEGRFTYQDHGLELVQDLGAWWEEAKGLPIPLGVIVMRRTLGRKMHVAMEKAMRRSLAAGLAHPDRAAGFIASHAQELDPRVIGQHVQTFVNNFSMELGREGERCVQTFLNSARGLHGLGPVVDIFPE
ncbi:1,4-dihydroxy-6-naphthoate synthase [Oceanidesulfovibrio indonesiensis]|uniref:1,4-dihydroxy-6-naphtoate synthase n=1 Tax=Oceanidesulfovibrio indonesiensis TaxID=54767 RepID=A0A7M3MDJ8_9BACT|nr:1,4-dihydroxy-6-naphthoate synthase [Oceanidesulfovibrio indonesiensis]TVM16670.1 1,4-dihydroxy-6-naphthoate synthase [Oceanidesulfovibrio indonesiensis]